MAALSEITLVNIQSHVNTKFEFPSTGIIRLAGENSNGKSVLVKVISDIASNAISRPRARKSLIRRGNSYGEINIKRDDGVTLYVKIHEEAAQTFAELKKPNEKPIRRYLSDKAIPLLVQETGFHYSESTGISINIHQDDDKLLFVSTKHSVNYELMGPSLSDPYAERSLDGLEVLLKEASKLKKDMTHQRDVAAAALGSIQVWDVEEESKRRDAMAYLCYNLRLVDIPPMPTIRAVPKVSYLKVLPSPPVLRYPEISKELPNPPDILSISRELQTLHSGICPTCHRNF